jgi:hypothetical protein
LSNLRRLPPAPAHSNEAAIAAKEEARITGRLSIYQALPTFAFVATSFGFSFGYLTFLW